MMKTIFYAAAIAILITTPLFAQNHACQRVVDAELRNVGVTPDSISSTRIERDYEGGEDARIIGYTYWIRMKACQKGYLLVTLWEDCLPIGVPATVYGCEIAGIKKD